MNILNQSAYNKYWESLEKFSSDRSQSGKPYYLFSGVEVREFCNISEKLYNQSKKDNTDFPFGFKMNENSNWVFGADSICRWFCDKEKLV